MRGAVSFCPDVLEFRGLLRRVASGMIASVEQEPAPRRLVLGSDSWQALTAALTDRLADVRLQQQQAASTDY